MKNFTIEKKIIILMMYSGFFKLFGLYQFVSLSIDVLLIIYILTQFKRYGVQKRDIIFVLFLSFFAILCVAQLINPNLPSLYSGFLGMRKILFPWLLFFPPFLRKYYSRRNVDALLLSLFFWGIPVALYGVKQHFFYSSYDDLFIFSNNANMYTGMMFGELRATSIFSGPFHLSYFSVIFFLVGIYLFHNSGYKKINKFYSFGIIIGLVTYLLSCYSAMSRTNLIALAVSIVAFYLIQKMSTYKGILSLFVVIVSIFFGATIIEKSAGLLLSENYLLRMIGTILNFNSDTRFMGREAGWKESLGLIAEHPIIAYGMGSAGDAIEGNYMIHITSHNFFIKNLIETGIIGGLLIVLIIITSFVRLIKNLCMISTDSPLSALSLAVGVSFIINAFVGSTIEMYPSAGIALFIIALSLSSKLEME